VFFLEIEDEAAGEFVRVKQNASTGISEITIEPNEWPALRAAIDDFVKFCREEA
jgi:hypothetical protein